MPIRSGQLLRSFGSDRRPSDRSMPTSEATFARKLAHFGRLFETKGGSDPSVVLRRGSPTRGGRIAAGVDLAGAKFP